MFCFTRDWARGILNGLTRLRLSSRTKNDEFEWDDAKAARNLRDHGVTFDEACEVFRDPFVLGWLDTRDDYGEDRYATMAWRKTACSMSPMR